MEWTFDPFELKNAYFNIERLGAVVRRYVLNQYGTTSSPLHGGLPTDRCTAEWWLGSPRVNGLLAGTPVPRPAVEERIALPANIAEIRSRRTQTRPRNSKRNERAFPRTLHARPRRDRLREIRRPRRLISSENGNENRQSRSAATSACRWCISLKPASAAPTSRDILIVEVVSEGLSGWGEVTAGENPFYNEEWTDSAWPIVRDYAAPARAPSRTRSRCRRCAAHRSHPRAQHGARRSRSRRLGSRSAASRQPPLAAHRRRRAARNSLRRLHRHSGFRRPVDRENRTRTHRRLPAHQNENQTRLGCRCRAPGARTLPQTSC